MTRALKLKIEEGVPEDFDEIDRRLVAFNKEKSDWNSQFFTVEIRDSEGALKGGAGGRLNLGAVEVRTLWSDEDLRGTGWGRNIVNAIMEEGRRLGAAKILLDTYDFQARPCHEPLGCSVFGPLG